MDQVAGLGGPSGEVVVVHAVHDQQLGANPNAPPGAYATGLPGGPDARPQQRALENSTVVKLKGLPYTTSATAIVEFFVGYDVKRVEFVLEPDGRPSGLAFAEFGTKDEALKALSKNGEYLGGRYIRLLHVPRAEMEEQVRLGTLAVPGAAARMRSRMARAQQQQQLPPRNMAYVSGPVQLMQTMVPGGRPVMGMAHGGQQPYGGQGGGQQPYGGQGGGQQVDSRMWQQAAYQGAPPYHNAGQQQQQGGQQAQQQYQSSPMQLSQQLAGLSIGGGGGGQQQQQQGGGLQRGGVQPMLPHTITLQPPPPGAGPGQAMAGGGVRPLQAATSPVVKIRGLPYRSSPNEILAFFQGYSFIPDSLQIGLDQLGRPSGEAWLSFVSAQEALRAVRDLNRHYLGNRYLELSIC